MAGVSCPVQIESSARGMMMHPGPGVDGPGPGVCMYQPGGPATGMTSQIKVCGSRWHDGQLGHHRAGRVRLGSGGLSRQLQLPAGAIYRLKLSNIPGRAGTELYPTLEVAPAMPRTEAYLAHNSIPVQFTPEDFDQVISGNFVTKVLYLPDPAFQELALAGVETLVSTRLEPGVDPIVEADRRGAILAIVRLGQQGFAGPGRPQPRRHGHARPRMKHTAPAAARRRAMCRASTDRSTECRCAARRSACLVRRACRSESPLVSIITRSPTIRTFACRRRRTPCAST